MYQNFSKWDEKNKKHCCSCSPGRRWYSPWAGKLGHLSWIFSPNPERSCSWVDTTLRRSLEPENGGNDYERESFHSIWIKTGNAVSRDERLIHPIIRSLGRWHAFLIISTSLLQFAHLGEVSIPQGLPHHGLYPLEDLLLLGFVAGGHVSSGGRGDKDWV